MYVESFIFVSFCKVSFWFSVVRFAKRELVNLRWRLMEIGNRYFRRFVVRRLDVAMKLVISDRYTYHEFYNIITFRFARILLKPVSGRHRLILLSQFLLTQDGFQSSSLHHSQLPANSQTKFELPSTARSTIFETSFIVQFEYDHRYVYVNVCIHLHIVTKDKLAKNKFNYLSIWWTELFSTYIYYFLNNCFNC